MDIRRLERDFKRRYERMSDDEVERFNDEWSNISGDLLDFYGIRKELKTAEEVQRFLDYLYMYTIAYNKQTFDERYDQPLFSTALDYAKKHRMGMCPTQGFKA